MLTSQNSSNGQDHLLLEERSRNMSKIRQNDTTPEINLRKMLHREGFRFRKNVKNLPGTPDIVLPKYKTVIFVHGCFWHRHDCRRGRSFPSSRKEFWVEKFRKNVERDKQNYKSLLSEGWHIIIVWECELSSQKKREKKSIELTNMLK